MLGLVRLYNYTVRPLDQDASSFVIWLHWSQHTVWFHLKSQQGLNWFPSKRRRWGTEINRKNIAQFWQQQQSHLLVKAFQARPLFTLYCLPPPHHWVIITKRVVTFLWTKSFKVISFQAIYSVSCTDSTTVSVLSHLNFSRPSLILNCTTPSQLFHHHKTWFPKKQGQQFLR